MSIEIEDVEGYDATPMDVVIAITEASRPTLTCLHSYRQTFVREVSRPGRFARVVLRRKSEYAEESHALPHCHRCGYVPSFWAGLLRQIEREKVEQAKRTGRAG